MNRYQAVICFLLLSLLAAGVGCSEELTNPPPENLIGEDTYIDLIIELQLLESYRTSMPRDSLRVSIDSLRQVIFDKYDVTEQQFVSSHQYFHRQVKPQVDRISRAIDSLRQQMVRDGIMDSTRLGQ
ncbi:DUF4296 domain-containing protein [Halalkalibaculum sp. DA3122]|uniref:DUF4296 domain-containing protein n=1 Tax=unclassified Halalkalibaculum TaxID=2964617 RepID=UPI003754A1B8